jgi:hypothetical protein
MNNQNDKIKEDGMGRHVDRIWEKMNAYRTMMRKPEGKETPRKI